MQFLPNYLERLLYVLYDIALRRHRDLPWIFWLFLICCYKFADWLGLFVLGLSICGVGLCSMRQGIAIHHRLISSKTETHPLHPAAYRCTCSKGCSDLTNCPNLQIQIYGVMMIWNCKCILFPLLICRSILLHLKNCHLYQLSQSLGQQDICVK